MKVFLPVFLLLSSLSMYAQSSSANTGYIKLSQTFLYTVKTGDSSDVYVQQLATANEDKLKEQLQDDANKKVFWLNLYNAFVQKILTEHSDQYKTRNTFFSNKQTVVAGHQLSLDDIEHGMLRRSKVKWSLGYLNKIFSSEFERKFRVDTLDNRVHFALNCGAKSCPPIAYYHSENIDKELELAARNYLNNEVSFSKDSSLVYLPKTMSWFREDFGGKKGMRKLLAHYNIPVDKDVRIRFRPYNWSLFLRNYKAEHN